MRHARLPLVPAAALALLAACASAGGPEPAAVPVPPAPEGALRCPTDVAREGERAVDAAGGVVEVAGHRLRVPEGAVDGEVRFRIVEPPAAYVFAHVLPDGQPFQRRAVLTLSYARCPADTEIPDDLALHRWDPQTRTWERLVSRSDPDAREVSAEVEHLSGYIIAGS